MTYKTELKAAQIACNKVKDTCAKVEAGEEAAKHLPSYRLEAGERIRALYIAGKEVGKTKAQIAKDLGYSVSWMRELAGADTPEKAGDAKAKAAARKQKERRDSHSHGGRRSDENGQDAGARTGGSTTHEHTGAEPADEPDNDETAGAVAFAETKSTGNTPTETKPADDEQPEATDDEKVDEMEVFKVLNDYKQRWREHCLPHLTKIRSIRSDARFDEIYSWYWFDVETWMRDELRDEWKTAHDDGNDQQAVVQPPVDQPVPAEEASACKAPSLGPADADLDINSFAGGALARTVKEQPAASPITEPVSAGEVQGRAACIGAKIKFRGDKVVLITADDKRQIFDDVASAAAALKIAEQKSDAAGGEAPKKHGRGRPKKPEPASRTNGNGVDPEAPADERRAA